jgi:hypothetical protein
METSSCARWRRHFETQSTRPLPSIPKEISGLPYQRELVRSLAIFQLGEMGEGRIANQIDHVQLPGIDHDYRIALKLFVKEEGRHARVLAAMVRALGGELIHETWTAALFVRARRLAGIRLKLLVLLVAEVVSVVCYGLIAAKLPTSASRTALLQIAADERNHLRFHADFFSSQVRDSTLRRALFHAAFFTVGTAATLVVLIDHRPLFRALGHSPVTCVRRFRRVLVTCAMLSVRVPVRGRAA